MVHWCMMHAHALHAVQLTNMRQGCGFPNTLCFPRSTWFQKIKSAILWTLAFIIFIALVIGILYGEPVLLLLQLLGCYCLCCSARFNCTACVHRRCSLLR